MDDRHKQWHAQRELLKALVQQPGQHQRAVAVFLGLHAAVHVTAAFAAADGPVDAATGAGAPTFADDALAHLSEAAFRCLPPGAAHSAAWLVWHIARCEDITMTLLVAGEPQVLNAGWAEKVCSPAPDTGNGWDRAALEAFNAAVSPGALLAYRDAVARRTRAIVQALAPGDFARKVAPERIRRAAEERAVAPADDWLLQYWGARTTAGLLLMPATRHPLVHLDEILRLRKKIKA